MILEQGLSPATRAAIATIDPPPISFTIWKKKALTIGAMLDTINTLASKFTKPMSKPCNNSISTPEDYGNEIRGKHQQEGACTNCGEKGH